MKSLDKKKTGFRKMTANDLRRGIDLSKTISGFKVYETMTDKNKPKELKQNSTNPYKYGDDMKKFVDKNKPKELDKKIIVIKDNGDNKIKSKTINFNGLTESVDKSVKYYQEIVKPKELDWERNLTVALDMLEQIAMGKAKIGGDFPNPRNIIKHLFEYALTQQRTELLEEIKKKIIKGVGKRVPEKRQYCNGYNDAICEIINLLNKKD